MKKKKKNRFLELADKYRDGTVPPCSHFGECGGCMFQDISYGNQLLLKREYLNSLMEGITSVKGVNPSDPYSYRNRMDMVVAFGKTGLRKRGNYRHVVDIESCSIMQEKSGGIFRRLRPMLLEYEGYDYLNHAGYLRYAVFRQGFYTGEVLVSLVTAVKENRLREITGFLMNKAESVSLLFNDGLADLSFGEIYETVGRDHIIERFDGIHYRITPNSFFQSNSPVALQMYRRIKEMAEGEVLDLYSGIGSISLFIADAVKSVTGVETVEEAVETAEKNAELNSIRNTRFIAVDVRKYLRETGEHFDTVILDPPRSGMHPRAIKHLLRRAPERIIYMSCNPSVFRNELDPILEAYRLDSFEAFDMFPQTPHMETLALLSKK